MKKITVATTSHHYPIYIGAGLLKKAQYLKPYISGDQVLVVTNETIAPLYLSAILQSLQDYQCDIIVLPDGEQYKTLETVNQIFEKLMTHHHHRDTTLIALGGGVIGDITGFAAACYQRGVAFIQVPTSLLAQVDASIGGKTAVNHISGKNMIGAFHQPRSVLIDTQVLFTLPQRHYISAMAEVIKHALIGSKHFFTWLCDNRQALLDQQPEAIEYAISRCCEIKASIVAEDETERGLRAILNLGHTTGHAIESGLGYGQWTHGEAVAIGLVVASRLSHLLGDLPASNVEVIHQLLVDFGLPTCPPAALSAQHCLQQMQADKKITKSGHHFILLKQLGQAYICGTLTDEQLLDVLQCCGFS